MTRPATSSPAGVGTHAWLPEWPAGLVLPPLTAPSWGWPGWADAHLAWLKDPGQASQDQHDRATRTSAAAARALPGQDRTTTAASIKPTRQPTGAIYDPTRGPRAVTAMSTPDHD